MRKSFSIRHPSKRRQRGAEAIEFAFTFPIAILLIISIFEFGRAIWIWHSMQEAMNITGRYAMYNPAKTDDELKTYFQQNISAVPPASVSLAFGSSTTGTMPFTTITATYIFVPVTGLIPSLNITLSSTARIPRV